MSNETVSVIGICYTGVVPAHLENNTVKGAWSEDPKVYYHDDAVRLSENDSIAQFEGKPIYLDHDPSKGSFGTVKTAWLSTTSEPMERFVKESNRPPDGLDPNRKVIGLRALLDKSRLPEVYDQLKVKDLKEIALSVGYIFATDTKNKVTQVSDKKVMEVSLCNLGFYQKCGIVAQLSNTQLPTRMICGSATSNIIEEDTVTKESKKESMSAEPALVPVETPVTTPTTPDVDPEKIKKLVELAASNKVSLHNVDSVDFNIQLLDRLEKQRLAYQDKIKDKKEYVITAFAQVTDNKYGETCNAKISDIYDDDSTGGKLFAKAFTKVIQDSVAAKEVKATAAVVAEPPKPTPVVPQVDPITTALRNHGVTASAVGFGDNRMAERERAKIAQSFGAPRLKQYDIENMIKQFKNSE